MAGIKLVVVFKDQIHQFIPVNKSKVALGIGEGFGVRCEDTECHQ